MDWIKIKPQHVLFSLLRDTEGYALVKLQCLTAHIEAMPTEEQMLKVVHHKTLRSLQGRLKEEPRNLQGILKEVLRDVQGVAKERALWKDRKRKQRIKEGFVPQDVPVVSRDRVDKLSIDKIREEKSTKEMSKLFEDLWQQYPNRDGKKAAIKHFNASVKNEQDIQDIKKALKNYKEHLECVTWKQPKNGSTWFNGWRDWIEPTEEQKHGKPKGNDREDFRKITSEPGKYAGLSKKI